MSRARLRPFGRLDRYVGGLFASSYATALFLVVGLFWILELASQAESYFEPWDTGEKLATSVILRYHLFNLPYLFLQVAPFVTLLAAMFTVNRLLRQNEIVAGLGAGVSAQRLLLPVFVGGALAAVTMIGVREFVSGSVATQRDALLDVIQEQRHERVIEDLWLRDLDGNIARLGEFRPGDGTATPRVSDFEAILRSPGGVAVVRAPEIVWDAGRWELGEGMRYRVGDTKEAVPVTELEDVEFTPELALTYARARVNPLELSGREVRDLMRRDPDNVVYQTLWQYNLTFPLANLVLLLVGLPLMLGHERGRGSERAALGGALCIFYFAADFIFRSLGLQGGLSPVLASWLPVLMFGSLGVVLVDSMRS